MRRAVLLAIACGALAACGGSGPRPTTFMSEACGLPAWVQHPPEFSFSCDGARVFTHVRWENWGASRATGTAELWIETCRPDCAAGPSHEYSARLTAHNVEYCAPHRRVYGTITAAFGNQRQSEQLHTCVS